MVSRVPTFAARASLALISRSAVRVRRGGLGLFAACAILAHLLAVAAIVELPAAMALLRGAHPARPQPPGQATVELVMQDTPSVGGSKPASPAPPQAKPAPKTAKTAVQPTPPPLTSPNSTDTVAAPAATASAAPPRQTPAPQPQQSPATTTASAEATEVNLDPYNPPGTGIVSGDNVVPASPDNAHNNVPPSYPIDAERRGEQGVVGLIITVSPDGHAADVQIASSSGHKLLDDEARRAVSRWHFRPEIRDGHPVSSIFNEQIDFDGSGQDR